MANELINELTKYFLDNKFIMDEVPLQPNERTKTESTIEYLFDNDFTEEDIYNVIDAYEEPVKFMHPENLPDCLWDTGTITINPNNDRIYTVPSNLIKRNRYLFHDQLKLWSEEGVHYIEPKIAFTYEDLLDYFIRTHRVNTRYLDMTRARRDLYYMYLKFNSIVSSFAETVDFFLWIMDQYPIAKTIAFFDRLDDFEEKLDYFQSRVENFKYMGYGIVWRADARCT